MTLITRIPIQYFGLASCYYFSLQFIKKSHTKKKKKKNNNKLISYYKCSVYLQMRIWMSKDMMRKIEQISFQFSINCSPKNNRRIYYGLVINVLKNNSQILTRNTRTTSFINQSNHYYFDTKHTYSF